MSDHTPIDLDVPLAPEMNLYFFMREMSGALSHLEVELLEHLVAAGTTRGWFPKVAQLVERFSDHETADAIRAAITDLRRRRLLYLAADGEAIASIVGGVTHQKTAITVTSEEGIPFHVLGAIDALTVAPMLQKAVHVRTKCAISGAPIELELDAEGHLTKMKPASLTAFVPGWDGTASIPETVSQNSHFFTSDKELHAWQHAHGEPEGMPLTEHTLRSVGLEMAHAMAALYVKMSVK